ncbi:MAG: chemotaxis protein CheW [Sulfuricurvum sp.]
MNELIVFRLSGEYYGIEVTRVREIKTYETPTHLPGTKPFVLGVINIRGEIVPVIDLTLRFDDQAVRRYCETTLIVTTKTSDNRMVAVVVDAIETLAYFSPNDIIGLGEEMFMINHQFLAGLVDIEHHYVSIINVDTLFSQEEINHY